MNIIYLVLAGVVSGIIGGLGMGGGTLLIPILTIFLSFNQKNTPKIFCNILFPIISATDEPAIEKRTPVQIIGIPTLKSTSLFFMCIMIATIAIGIKTSKLIACAFF